jgi:hypothetical protein
MLVYPSFIYLQNHKTGCTFVETCLRKFCTEPLQAYHKHAVLTSAPGRFCFINVREPLALYRSLFTYGLDGKGTVYLRLKRMGHGSLYEEGASGFSKWLDFIIKPQHASLLSDAYKPVVAKLVGFMTWRFLRLACPGFEQDAPRLPDAAALTTYVKANNVLKAVLHQEKLKDELKILLTGKLARYFPDQVGLSLWLDQSPRINASQTILADVAVKDEILVRLLRNEAFLYRNFYPHAIRELRHLK